MIHRLFCIVSSTLERRVLIRDATAIRGTSIQVCCDTGDILRCLDMGGRRAVQWGPFPAARSPCQLILHWSYKSCPRTMLETSSGNSRLAVCIFDTATFASLPEEAFKKFMSNSFEQSTVTSSASSLGANNVSTSLDSWN